MEAAEYILMFQHSGLDPSILSVDFPVVLRASLQALTLIPVPLEYGWKGLSGQRGRHYGHVCLPHGSFQ